MKKRPAPSPFLSSSSLHDSTQNQMRSATAMPTGSRTNFCAGDENKNFDASNKASLMKRRAMRNAPPPSSSLQAPKRPPWVSPNTRSPIRFTHNPSPPPKLSPSPSPRKILGERNESVEPHSPSQLPLLLKLGKRMSPTATSVTVEDDCSIISKSASASSSLSLPFLRRAEGEEVLEEDLHRRMQEFLDEQMFITPNNQAVEQDGGRFLSPKMAYNNPIFVPTSPPMDSREEGVLFPSVNCPEGDGSSDLEETPKMGILSSDSDRHEENKEAPVLIAVDTSAVMEISKEQVNEEMCKCSEFDRTPKNKETPTNNQADLIAVDTSTVTEISKKQIIEELLRTPENNNTPMNNLADQATADDYTEREMKEDDRAVATDIFTQSPFPSLVRTKEIGMINSPSLREAFIEEDGEEVLNIEMISSEEDDEHDDNEGSMIKASLRCLFMLICFGTVLLSSDNPQLLPSAIRPNAVSLVVEGYLKPYQRLSQEYMTVFNGLWDENMSSSCYIPVGNLEDLQMPSSLRSFLGHTSKWVSDSGAIDISVLIWSEIESCFARFARWVSDILWHKSSQAEGVVSDNVSDEDLLDLFREWDLIHEYDLQAAANDLQSRSSGGGKEELTKSLLSLTDDPDVQLLLMDLMEEDGNRGDRYEAFQRQQQTTGIDDNAAASDDDDDGDEDAMQSSSTFMGLLEKGAADMMISESQTITYNFGEGPVRDMTETSELAQLPEEHHPIQQLVDEIRDTVSSAQGLPDVEEMVMAIQKQQIFLEESTCPIHSFFAQAMRDLLGFCDLDAVYDGYAEMQKLPLIFEQAAVAQSSPRLLLNWGRVPPLVVSAIAMSVAIVMMMAIQQVNRSQIKKKKGRLNSDDVSALPLREVEFLRRTTPMQQKQMEEEGSTANGYDMEVSYSYDSEVKAESTTTVHSRLDSPSLGSFVAYELLPKEGQVGNSSAEKKLTPVRRSSRLLRTQVMSPLKPRRVALSPP